MNEQLLTRQESFSLEPRNLQEAMNLARIMADSDMVPKDYRGKPANVLVAVQMGRELGLSPMQSIQNISVINGRPSVWGDAMLALCSAHPSCEDVVESYDSSAETATCVVRRRGREPIARTFSVPDAKKAGLWGKQGPWQQYPQRMLQMRARAFALRDGFADVLRGLGMAEENQDIPQEPPKNVTPRPAPVKQLPAQQAPAQVIEAQLEVAPQNADTPIDNEDVFEMYAHELSLIGSEPDLRAKAKEWTWAEKDRERAVEIYKARLTAIRQQAELTKQRAQQQPPWDEIEQQAQAQQSAAVSREPGSDG